MKILTKFRNWMIIRGIRATEFFGVLFSLGMLVALVAIVLSGIIISNC